MLLAFLRFAAAQGWKCDIYYPLEGPTPSKQEEEVRASPVVERVYPIPIHYRTPHFWRAYEFARRCEFRNEYDMRLLATAPFLYGSAFVRRQLPFTAWVACSLEEELRGLPRTRLRHYVLYNPLTLWAARRLESRCARSARSILGISSYTVEHVRRDFDVSAEKLRVVPVPVDPDLFTPGKPRSRPRPYILSVARLERRKDFPTLLRAFREVRRSRDVELRIVGSGPVREQLERLAEELGLGEDVRFLGHVSLRALREEYAGASLFALASRQEGLGIVFLEAMASGLPVVTTDSGGSADPVVSGETGFLVQVGNYRALAAAMIEVLTDPSAAGRMGRAGRERVERRFSERAVHDLLRSAMAPERDAHASSAT